MEEKNYMPLIGDSFPQVSVNTTHGKISLPDDYQGKWFVLFSHPGDFTPVCTTEFVAFQKRYDKFRGINTELIGLSIDQVHSHIKWTEWIKDNIDIKIEFPIIADAMGSLAKQLGMISPFKGSNTVRAVFVVDPEGKFRTILYYPQEVGRNMDEILRTVKALQVSDENKVAVPANWPENEIVGDHVIVPPASDEKTAEERMEQDKKGEIKCLDWWLCHKKI
jgi:peroxiredoxin (alkyl hydroperoxide reductase subunit C)